YQRYEYFRLLFHKSQWYYEETNPHFCKCFTSLLSFSQYKTAEGARFSGIPSLSVKFDKNLIISIESLLVGFGRGVKVTVLVETYKYAFDHHTLGLVDIWERFCFIYIIRMIYLILKYRLALME
ncbi:MAG: hypothetical protein QMB24_00875, partial [Spirosomataceae bacterium]